MPLVEYVGFMLDLNTLHERDKLQRMQNKALCMCFNIHDPRDLNILDFHNNARIDMLKRRRDNHLLYIMYDLCQNAEYKKPVTRITRNVNCNIFYTKIVNYTVYEKSPYYIGATLWNGLPQEIQDQRTKNSFKTAVQLM